MAQLGLCSRLVNFFGHAFVAAWFSNVPEFVLGAMLPDFATMVGARLPVVSSASVQAGVELHHRTDEIFHSSVCFKRLEREAYASLRASGVRHGPSRGVAHVGIELLLDAELARQNEAACRAYVEALEAARLRGGAELLRWGSQTVALRFEALRCLLLRHRFRFREREAELTAARLERILQGRPRLALDSSEVSRVVAWVNEAEVEVSRYSEQLLKDLRQRLEAG